MKKVVLGKILLFGAVFIYLILSIVTALGWVSIKLDGVEVEGFVWRFIHALWIMPLALFFAIFAMIMGLIAGLVAMFKFLL